MATPLLRAAARLSLCVVTAIACPLVATSAAADGRHDLVVPRDHPTIQAAVDAADAGDRIAVRPGVYREQVVIDKDVSIVGSGDRSTTILAPRTLTPGVGGSTSIVEIHNGATVSLSRLAVSGPGSGTCEKGALGSGIRVLEGARLDLGHAAVTHIADTPAAPCFRSANAVRIGEPRTSTGSATIRHTEITGYQGAGVVVLNAGSTATIEHSTVTGHRELSTNGIEFVAGSAGRVTHSTISDNECREPDPGCGPDFFNEVQHAGILADSPGTVVRHNRIVGNQVGVSVAGGGVDISHNNIRRNSYVGIALQDGSFTVRKDRIEGGVHGVAVVPKAVDTHAVLDGVRIGRTSGAPVQTFACCGFTATAAVER
ncbi:right-handed parallel beta-helix repeat-containing protein [Streptomyces sp. NPDC096176]|uniref:right-handed parallel beta-helix repeat-containing protein n=1 Tax=Streptomyces sp. NPDC096176 TaxID=3366079 RepID=UPI00382C3947